jgi:hypothetical protein
MAGTDPRDYREQPQLVPLAPLPLWPAKPAGAVRNVTRLILLGCSTGSEIHGRDVQDETLGTTALHFARTHIAAATDVPDMGGSFMPVAIGAQLSRPDLAAIFVLSDGTRVNGSELVRGLRTKIGADVVLTGGLAGDGARFGTYVGLNSQPIPGKVAAVDSRRCHQVGHGSCGGWDVFDQNGA